jgi:DNA-nicking Smr family endonuclease
LKDFSDILAAWESKGGAAPTTKEEPVAPSKPTRTAMEKAPIDDEIDLHGHLKDEAVLLLRNFLTRSRNDGARKVMVIHGKGLHSDDGKGVLKQAVRQVIGKNPNVAAWGEAGRTEGGSGATWVWLT